MFIGHLTFVLLLMRPCLSVFQNCYTYIQRHPKQLRYLWNSVILELRVAYGLLSLVCSQFDTAWSETVKCSDATLFGFAVHETAWSQSDVARVGRDSDRWRFKHNYFSGARASALAIWDEHELGLPSNADEHLADSQFVLDSDPNFPDVSPQLILNAHWSLVQSKRVIHKEATHVKEARAVLWSVRRLCKQFEHHGL